MQHKDINGRNRPRDGLDYASASVAVAAAVDTVVVAHRIGNVTVEEDIPDD